MIQGIHHFAIISSSEECTLFYKKLGFKELKRIKRKKDTVVLLEGYGIQIEMFIDASHPERSVPEPLGVRHIALHVDSIERTLQELGFETKTETLKDWVDVPYVFLNDPDGNVVELHE